jgi:3-methyl-2-oxobutanoate hydroxymethyltransferase
MSTQNPGAGRKVSELELLEMKKRGEKIVALTAYDYPFARIVDAAGVDVVLVGDSVGNVVLGHETTVAVTLDDMIHHARAVRRGVERALLVVDMPFMSYQVSAEEAVRNAGRIMKETGAAAVKLEGGTPKAAAAIEAIVEAGIPVMGHIGFTPQSIHALGGTRVQGRGDSGRDRVLEQARRIDSTGAFSIVLELIPGGLAEEVTAAVSVPTIGIGAGVGCDGQVLVLYDMLGLNRGFNPRFLRTFADLGAQAETGVLAYVNAVRTGEYPAAENTFES